MPEPLSNAERDAMEARATASKNDLTALGLHDDRWVRQLAMRLEENFVDLHRCLEEIARLNKLPHLYRLKRNADGLNGRSWDATQHLAAENAIAALDRESGLEAPTDDGRP